jgi:RNA polymerase sigma-70 factor, ECF subfamily
VCWRPIGPLELRFVSAQFNEKCYEPPSQPLFLKSDQSLLHRLATMDLLSLARTASSGGPYAPAGVAGCGYNGEIPPVKKCGQRISDFSRAAVTALAKQPCCGESAMPSDESASRATINPDADPRAVFEHFSRRLIALARVHLDARLQQKVDPEDVVQSAYKSFLIRYGDGALAAEGWEGLWGLLTLITVRKCADRARYYEADCRNLHREAPATGSDQSVAPWLQAAGREPTPDEAAVLAETVEELLARLRGDERAIVELSLQGYSTQEISRQIGRAERSVRRLRELVRKQLEQQRAAAV